VPPPPPLLIHLAALFELSIIFLPRGERPGARRAQKWRGMVSRLLLMALDVLETGVENLFELHARSCFQLP